MKILENKNNLLIIDNQDITKQVSISLYSYNSLIATYEKNHNCKSILLLTNYYNYSTTTSKHLNYFINNYCNNIDKKNIEKNQSILENHKKYDYIIFEK